MVRIFACAATFLLFLIAPASSQPRAVLELFTSQGCPSSPKADDLANWLVQDPNVLVLTYSLDYWDYLGWKDTLALPGNSARWRAYGLARGDRRVFTPQVIVNGTTSTMGSDKAAIESAVLKAEDHPDVPIDIREQSARIEVKIGSLPRAAEVWMIAYSSQRTVEIAKGDNAGRTITYNNVVRRMTRLGAVNGKPAHFLITRSEAVPADADRYLVMVQAGTSGVPGPILAAQVASR